MLSRIFGHKHKPLEKEIEVDDWDTDLSILARQFYPAVRLKFKIINKTEVYLTTKSVIAWVLYNGAGIDKITWFRQEKKLNRAFTTYHSIEDVPPKEDIYFELYYPLPPSVDLAKYELGLEGVIEFDSAFGTILKDFRVGFEVSKEEWKKALNNWQFIISI